MHAMKRLRDFVGGHPAGTPPKQLGHVEPRLPDKINFQPVILRKNRACLLDLRMLADASLRLNSVYLEPADNPDGVKPSLQANQSAARQGLDRVAGMQPAFSIAFAAFISA